MSEFSRMLEEAEGRATSLGVDYSSEQMQKQRILQHPECNGGYDYYYSNEGDLRVLFEHVKYSSLGVVGVGSDQVLDLLASTQANKALLIDYSRESILRMRTELELGTRHWKTFQKYPTPERFIEYFLPENSDQLRRILDTIYTPQEATEAMDIFGEIPFFGSQIPFSEYMIARVDIKEDNGISAAWYGTPSKLAKIIQSYSEGNVILSLSDLTDRSHIAEVADFTKENGSEFDVVYLSNFEEFHPKSVWDILDLLPIDPDAKVLRSFIWPGQPISDQVMAHPILRRISLPFKYEVASYSNRKESPYSNRHGFLLDLPH